MLSGGGGVYTSRLSEALRRNDVVSRVLSLDDGSLLPPGGLPSQIFNRHDWALSGMLRRRSRGPVLSFHRRQLWNPEVEIQGDDIVHLHSITGFIGDGGLRHLLRHRPRVFWTAHNPWLFTGGCVAYAGCDRFESGCKMCPLLKFPLERWTSWELKAKVNFWRDFGVQPIANSEWMAGMMRRSPLFRGMDISVVPPIVDKIFTANAKNLRSEKLNEDLTAEDTTEYRVSCEIGQPKVGPKGEIVGASESKCTEFVALWSGGNRFVVGMSARALTDKGKGIEEFFQRLPLNRAFLKQTTFVLIGDGKIRVPAGLDCRFPGHVDSPARLALMYRSLDLFVSASAMETFGMAILEAQACGTPVLAFEVGGTPEAVFPTGCKLVRDQDWARLFLELEDMFDSAVKGGGKKHELAEWVAKRHDWQSIAAKQIKIYGINPKNYKGNS